MLRYSLNNNILFNNIYSSEKKNHSIKKVFKFIKTKKVCKKTVISNKNNSQNNSQNKKFNEFFQELNNNINLSVINDNILHNTTYTDCLSICVIGASGDLAKKKIFPALFALYLENSLPDNFQIYGYARSEMTNQEFRELITLTLTCRVDKNNNYAKNYNECVCEIEEFLSRCFYQVGQYDNKEDFIKLNELISEKEVHLDTANRIFFFSIPPNLFIPVSHNCIPVTRNNKGFTRVILEKPFGKDITSSKELGVELSKVLEEDQIYRIDHYLGKELIDNLAVLRFSNLLFQPLWSRQYINNVQIIFSEPFGTEGRGGYFDQYGIIRDIMQNHLLQILTLFAMESPISLDAEDIRNEKVKVLKSMRLPVLEDLILGQYKKNTSGDKEYPSYVDDPTVPNDSICPTFAALALFIDNPRWDGVPFMMKAGKALDKRNAEIRIQFNEVPAQLYKNCGLSKENLRNELVIHIQPDEAIYLKINNKIPGLGLRLDNSNLNLAYKTRYERILPDAYERLLLDVINGDKGLFIRADELEASWEVFTPLLEEIEKNQIQPELYPYGSRGPIGSHYLASKYDFQWGDL